MPPIQGFYRARGHKTPRVVLIGKVQGVGSSAPHGTTLDAKQPSTPNWINLARYAKGQPRK